MKFWQLFGLIFAVSSTIQRLNFNLDQSEIQNKTIEISLNYDIQQISLKCDNYTNNLWNSGYYLSLKVTYNERQFYNCSDQNFTTTIYYDLPGIDYLSMFVNISSISQPIKQIDFIKEPFENPIEVSENQSLILSSNQISSNLKISVPDASTLYVEIFYCPIVFNFSTSIYDATFQYKNLTPIENTNYYYETFNLSIRSSTYFKFISSYSYQYLLNFKYQIIKQQELKYIQEYAKQSYPIKATVTQGKILVSIPVINTLNQERVQFRIAIFSLDSEQMGQHCAYGDLNLALSLANEYYNDTMTYIIEQKNFQVSFQKETFLFPRKGNGWYNIEIAAIIFHSQIQQTIPYEKVYVYQEETGYKHSKLIHILPPIIISFLSLIGLLFAFCRYKTKRMNELLKDQQNQIFNQQQFYQQQQ